jgi:TonB family protein
MYLKFHLIIIFSVFVCSNLVAQTDSLSVISDTTVYLGVVDKEPTIKGNLALHAFINSRLSNESRDFIVDKKIKGKVIILLVVDKEGKGTRFEVFKSLNSYMDQELLKVIKKIEWYPALVEGKPVNRRVRIPIIF